MLQINLNCSFFKHKCNPHKRQLVEPSKLTAWAKGLLNLHYIRFLVAQRNRTFAWCPGKTVTLDRCIKVQNPQKCQQEPHLMNMSSTNTTTHQGCRRATAWQCYSFSCFFSMQWKHMLILRPFHRPGSLNCISSCHLAQARHNKYTVHPEKFEVFKINANEC